MDAGGKKKFADAVVSRFGSPAPAVEPDSDDAVPGDAGAADKEDGAMLRAALKTGDNAALCEALRRICGR